MFKMKVTPGVFVLIREDIDKEYQKYFDMKETGIEENVIFSTIKNDGRDINIYKNTGWWVALGWQREQFFKYIELGTMKTMGYPNPKVETEIFKGPNKYNYRFIIYNDWGPVYLKNMNTNTKREIKYIVLDTDQKISKVKIQGEL